MAVSTVEIAMDELPTVEKAMDKLFTEALTLKKLFTVEVAMKKIHGRSSYVLNHFAIIILINSQSSYSLQSMRDHLYF